MRLSLLSFILMIPDLIPCMGIYLDEISLTATFPCDPTFTFSVQGHLIILVNLCQAGDAVSSQAPGFTSGLQGSVNVLRGALLLVPQ